MQCCSRCALPAHVRVTRSSCCAGGVMRYLGAFYVVHWKSFDSSQHNNTKIGEARFCGCCWLLWPCFVFVFVFLSISCLYMILLIQEEDSRISACYLHNNTYYSCSSCCYWHVRLLHVLHECVCVYVAIAYGMTFICFCFFCIHTYIHIYIVAQCTPTNNLLGVVCLAMIGKIYNFYLYIICGMSFRRFISNDTFFHVWGRYLII